MALTLTNIFIAFSFGLDNANNTQEPRCKPAKEMLSLLLLQNGKKNTLPIPYDKMAVDVQAAAPALLPGRAVLPKPLSGEDSA